MGNTLENGKVEQEQITNRIYSCQIVH